MIQEVRSMREKIKRTGLSYRQIYEGVGVSQGWFMRMIRGDFHEPNPEWMQKIDNFLDGYLVLLTEQK